MTSRGARWTRMVRAPRMSERATKTCAMTAVRVLEITDFTQGDSPFLARLN
jgi:hypothetical protein